MDYTSKEAKKLLKDYYYWRVLYRDKETRDMINRAFGYEDTKNYHDNVDHTLEIRRGIEKGILTAPVDRPHDEVISELTEICKTISVDDLVNGFLYSLSTGRNEYRTAIASYFFAKGLVSHKPERIYLTHGYHGCSVCGLSLNEDNICHIEDSFSRYILYSPNQYTIERIQRADYALFDLKQFKELPKVMYTENDVDILVKILKIADNMGDANKYTAVQKLITKAKIINASGNEIIVVLGVLSACGVFQTAEHKGYSERFTSCGDRGFVGYETELFYPLYFWKGRDGVNIQALVDVFPPFIAERMISDNEQLTSEEIYSKNKSDKSPASKAEAAFLNEKHIIELNNRRRHYYGLSEMDPNWDKEVRYSVTHKIYKRTEVYFDGNSIKKTIYEEKFLDKDGTFMPVSYRERDMVAETENRYLLLPKTSKGTKKPWTPSLLDTFTYVGASLDINLARGTVTSYNWQNNRQLPLPDKRIKSPIEFYTYSDEFIRSQTKDYENILKTFRDGPRI